MARQTISDRYSRTPAHTPRDRAAVPLRDELRELQEDRVRLKEEVARLEQLVGELSMQVDGAAGDPGKLLAVARQLDACRDRAEVLAALERIVRDTLGADDFLLLAHDEDGHTLWPMLGVGPNGAAFGPLSSSDELIAGVLRTGQRTVPAASPDATGASERHEAVACIPLRSGLRTVGVLVLFSLQPQRGPLDAAALELLDFISVHAATSLHLADLRAATMHRALSLL